MPPTTQKKVEDLAKLKIHAREVFETRLVKETEEIRKLDTHIQSFLQELRFDIGQHNREDLKKHIKDFESLVHDELEYLFQLTQKDIEFYMRVLKALSTFRVELKKLMEDDEYKSLAESEINYADLLSKAAQEKIETLQLLFKKIK